MIKQKPRLAKFMALSLVLHLFAAYVHYITPEKKVEPPEKKPVQVKFIPPEPEKPEAPTFVEAPRPAKEEKPRAEKLISNTDSRAHSSRKIKKENYQNLKTAIPKQSSERTRAMKPLAPRPAPKKKPVRRQVNKKSPAKKKRPLLKQTKKGTAPPERDEKKIEETPATGNNVQPIGALAMLNGLDADKYASLDTGAMEEDDDEPISLDTKETKYADYFARVKFQIEQVWTYPLEAARRGVSGQITLKFKLSREGNLVGIRLVNSSGTRTLDEAALNAVKKAAPYYPFPANINKEKITILATFIYSPTYSNNIYSYQ